MILWGCGSYIKIDPNLKEYQDKILSYCYHYKKDNKDICHDIYYIHLYFSENRYQTDDDTIISVCSYDNNSIIIKESIWNKLNKLEKEELILHEYGHCLLNRNHNDQKINMDNDYIYESLMYTNGFNSGIYIKYKDYYLTELFN